MIQSQSLLIALPTPFSRPLILQISLQFTFEIPLQLLKFPNDLFDTAAPLDFAIDYLLEHMSQCTVVPNGFPVGTISAITLVRCDVLVECPLVFIR